MKNKILKYFGENHTKVFDLSNNSIREVDGYYKDNFVLRNKFEKDKYIGNAYDTINCKFIKPILFPLESIITEIQTEFGLEIPIIEMAKIGGCIIKESKNNKLFLDNYDTAIFRQIVENGNTLDFEVDLDKFGFDAYCEQQDKCILISNPDKIIDYLYSRHIAINLNKSEYVNVLEFAFNPYINSYHKN